MRRVEERKEGEGRRKRSCELVPCDALASFRLGQMEEGEKREERGSSNEERKKKKKRKEKGK
jgi:hypothetical protein